jgi:hypothetical protein
MTPAHRLLSAVVITSDLIEDVIGCSTSTAIGIIVSLTSGGALECLGDGGYRLTDRGRAALERDAANAPRIPQDRAQPAPRTETEADIPRAPERDWSGDDDGRDIG